jgi:hypothetical protein
MTMQHKIQYMNRRGKPVELTISSHARRRFLLRWSHIFPDKPLTFDTVDAEISKWFMRSTRVEKLSGKERKRIAKHGNKTIFFRTQVFTFVVEDTKIVTVEISDSGKRHLNKHLQPTQPAPSTLPKIKFFAMARTNDGKRASVNLGRYESTELDGCVQKLRDDETFRGEMRRRFLEKKPSWKMLSVYAALGEEAARIGDLVKVFNEADDTEISN